MDGFYPVGWIAAASLLCAMVALWIRSDRLRRSVASELVQLQADLEKSNLECQQLEEELSQFRLAMEREVSERTAALRKSIEVGGRERDQARQREEQFRRAVEASPAAFVLVDANGTIQLVNSQTERSFGYDRGELIGEPVSMLIPEAVRRVHRDHVTRFMGSPRRAVLGSSRAMQGRRSDGTLFPVEIGLNPIVSPGGIQVLASVLDITDRQHSEQMLLLKTRELERSNRQLAEFASVVSHDLKSPLRGIASLAEWISDDHSDSLSQEGRDQFDLLRERTIWLHQMVEGLLEYSRAGRGSQQRTNVDAAEVVREVIDVLAPPANIEIRLEGQIPPCYTTEVTLGQVFQNLISNAIQHLGKPTGTITVRGRVLDGEVEYAVSDDGVGIPAEHQERIFRIFQTLQPAEKKARSSGIGLAIVQKIVEGGGGMLSVDSKPEEGATFLFTMPGQQ